MRRQPSCYDNQKYGHVRDYQSPKIIIKILQSQKSIGHPVMAWQNGAILMVDYNSWPSIIYGTLPNIAYVTMLVLFFQVRSITT